MNNHSYFNVSGFSLDRITISFLYFPIDNFSGGFFMQNKSFCPYCGHRLTERYYENRNRLFCNQCNDPIYENPTPATCLIVSDDKLRILLVQRSVDPKKGMWCLPGGFIELGESPENAALRELHEETGLTGRINKLLGVTTNPSRAYNSVLLVGYWVTTVSGTLTPGDDASDAAYFSIDNLPEIAFESHLKFIQDLTAADIFRQSAQSFDTMEQS